MAREVSQAVREQLYASEMSKVALVLLTIDHADLASPIYVVNNNQSIISNGNTFIATAFDFTPPSEKEGQATNASITIDNVDRSIVTAVRSISSAPDVTAVVIMADNPDVAEAGPWEFQLRNVTYNAQSVKGELYYQTYMRDIPGIIKYNNLNFPGLVQ